MKLKLKVVPGAKSDSWEWLGNDQDLLKIRITAPAEKGKANQAVMKYLSSLLKLPKSQVIITSGTSSQLKTVAINGLTLQQIRSTLTAL